MVKIEKAYNNKDGKELWHSNITGGNIKWCTFENNFKVSQNSVSVWPNNSTSRSLSKRKKNTYMNAHSRRTWSTIKWWMDNKMWYTIIKWHITRAYKVTADTCYSGDEGWKHYTKWKSWVTKDHILYDFTDMK